MIGSIFTMAPVYRDIPQIVQRENPKIMWTVQTEPLWCRCVEREPPALGDLMKHRPDRLMTRSDRRRIIRVLLAIAGIVAGIWLIGANVRHPAPHTEGEAQWAR